MFLLNKKLKELQVSNKSKTDALSEEKPEKVEKLMLTPGHQWVLFDIANAEDEKNQEEMWEDFNKEFPDATLLDLKSIITELEQDGLIRHSSSLGGDFYYRATQKGIKRMKRIIDAIRERKSKGNS